MESSAKLLSPIFVKLKETIVVDSALHIDFDESQEFFVSGTGVYLEKRITNMQDTVKSCVVNSNSITEFDFAYCKYLSKAVN